MSLNASPLDTLIRRIRDEAAWASPAARGAQDDLGEGGPMRLASTAPVEEQVRHPLARIHLRDFYLIDDNQDFVRFTYRSVLLRAADFDGFEASCRRLIGGASRASIVFSMRRSAEGKLAAVRIDGLAVAGTAWVLERALQLTGMSALARRVASFIDRWVARGGSDEAEESRARIGADLAVLRLVEQWRAPLEAHAGRTAVLEREVRLLRDTVRTLETNVQQLRGELHYARQSDSTLSNSTPSNSTPSNSTPSNSTPSNSTPSNSTPSNSTPSNSTTSEPTSSNDLDAYYVAFEDANRGTQQEFVAKLGVYAGVFESLQAPGQGPLLDIGCGRGELLDYLREMGIAVQGVDTNPVMVALCRERGHTVSHADALERLRSQPDNSLGAVSGFHIIEHLPFETLFNLVRECWRVLQPNGFILFETPNPENILVGSHTFYHDFTHRHPVTPTAVQFLARYHGFTALEIIRSSPYPDSAKVPGDDPLTRRVNGHLCGPQDFALLARKPDVALNSAQVNPPQ